MNQAGSCGVDRQRTASPPLRTGRQESVDEDSGRWLSSLRARGEDHEAAVRRLHELLLRAARFEAARRRPTLSGLAARELDDLTLQAADDALVAVLARLDSSGGRAGSPPGPTSSRSTRRR